MIRGLMKFRRAPDYQRAPDAHRTPHVHRAPDNWRASDSQRNPVFLAGPDGQRGPDCPVVLFCRFPHIFHDLCEGFGCLRLSLGPRVPENPREAHTFYAPPPPIGYVPGPEGGDLKLSSR